MNHWTELSIEFANQKSYLDDLFRIYPTIPDGIRDVDKNIWKNVENAFVNQDNEFLITELLKLDLFPIKDSYVAYLKHDKTALKRNPKTVNRICGQIYQLGLEKLFERCSLPKETNRQIGPMFRNWLKSKALGIAPVSFEEFVSTDNDAILDGSDKVLADFAREHLGYNRNKGLDFVARFNKKYVIGEAKFLTDFGGHQNAQFNDAVDTLKENVSAVKIAILDGVLYINNNSKMYKSISEIYGDYDIMSALVLREFLYTL